MSKKEGDEAMPVKQDDNQPTAPGKPGTKTDAHPATNPPNEVPRNPPDIGPEETQPNEDVRTAPDVLPPQEIPPEYPTPPNTPYPPYVNNPGKK